MGAGLGDSLRDALATLIGEFAWYTANLMWCGGETLETFKAVRPLVVDKMVPKCGTNTRFQCIIADGGNTDAKATKKITYKSGMKSHSMATATTRATIAAKIQSEVGGKVGGSFGVEGFGLDCGLTSSLKGELATEHMHQMQSEASMMTHEEKEEFTTVEVGGGKPTYVYLFRSIITIGSDEIVAGGTGVYVRSTPLSRFGNPDPTAAHVA